MPEKVGQVDRRLGSPVRADRWNGKPERHGKAFALRHHVQASRQGTWFVERQGHIEAAHIAILDGTEPGAYDGLQFVEGFAADHCQRHEVGGVVALIKANELLANVGIRADGADLADLVKLVQEDLLAAGAVEILKSVSSDQQNP